MTALSDRTAAGVVRGITKAGAAGSLVIPNGTYSAGAVTESATTVAVTMAGPIDESERYASTGADTRVTATFYLAASGLSVTPYNGCRIVFASKTYSVIATQSYSINAVVVAYRLDVGEIGSSG